MNKIVNFGQNSGLTFEEILEFTIEKSKSEVSFKSGSQSVEEIQDLIKSLNHYFTLQRNENEYEQTIEPVTFNDRINKALYKVKNMGSLVKHINFYEQESLHTNMCAFLCIAEGLRKIKGYETVTAYEIKKSLKFTLSDPKIKELIVKNPNNRAKYNDDNLVDDNIISTIKDIYSVNIGVHVYNSTKFEVQVVNMFAYKPATECKGEVNILLNLQQHHYYYLESIHLYKTY